MADATKSAAEHMELTEPSRLESQDVSAAEKLAFDSERAPEARGRDASAIERSYWLSARFLGSMAAIGLGFCGGTGGYALIAPVLGDINNDLGPSPNITWVSISYVATEAVFFLLVGRLSDLFGGCRELQSVKVSPY